MRLVEGIYYLGYRLHRAMQLAGQRRLPAPVISIGNITTGGTGKTPAAIALAREAARRGYRPCILTRGYGGRLKGPVLVTQALSAREAGDEPLLMNAALGDGLPIIKCAERYKGGEFALSTLKPRPDLFILDDGFQHRRLYRDIDILLVNSRDPFGGERLLPMGHLREPLEEIRRADFIVMTKCEPGAETEGLSTQLRELNPSAPIFRSAHRPMGIAEYGEGLHAGARHGMEWLRGRKVFAFSGIAEPESFRALLLAEGAELAGFLSYPDHYEFIKADLEDVRDASEKAGASWIITTEKDIMRLRLMGVQGVRLATLGLVFEPEGPLWDGIFERFGESRGNA